MLRNLLCVNACISCPADHSSKGEDCPDSQSLYDAWQEELTEFDKIVDQSGGRRALHPLCQTGNALCLPTTATCGSSLGNGGLSCAGPSFAGLTDELETPDHPFTTFPHHDARPGRVDFGDCKAQNEILKRSSSFQRENTKGSGDSGFAVGGFAVGDSGPGASPMVEFTAVPSLPLSAFDEELPHPSSSSSHDGLPVQPTFSGVSSGSESTMPSMPGDLPGEPLAQGVPELAENRSPRRSAYERRVSNTIIGREGTSDSGMRPMLAMPVRESTTDSAIRRKANPFVGREGTNDSGIHFTHWRGRCGFISRLRPETPEGPWMCHHFTVDGEHCVTCGIGPEHANSCAGVCRMMEAETFEDLAHPPRCMGLRKPVDGPHCPTLIKCVPAAKPCCTPHNCPFLFQGRPCPFVKRSGTDRRDDDQTLTRFNTEPMPHTFRVNGARRGGSLRGGLDGILIVPEGDDDMSSFDHRSLSL